eukprot:603441-Prymnesium_polylepis.1
MHEYAPKVIKALKGVRACSVAAGGRHSLVLSVSGDVYSFGDGRYGALGHGDEESQPIPKRIKKVTKVRTMAAGAAHNMLLTEAGVAYSFGNDVAGQLGRFVPAATFLGSRGLRVQDRAGEHRLLRRGSVRREHQSAARRAGEHPRSGRWNKSCGGCRWRRVRLGNGSGPGLGPGADG